MEINTNLEGRVHRLGEISPGSDILSLGSSRRLPTSLESTGDGCAEVPATQADIDMLFQKVKHHMNQMKNDLISEQTQTWKLLFGGVLSPPTPADELMGRGSSGLLMDSALSISQSVGGQFKKKAPTGPRRLSSRSSATPVYNSLGSRSAKSIPVTKTQSNAFQIPAYESNGSHHLAQQRSFGKKPSSRSSESCKQGSTNWLDEKAKSWTEEKTKSSADKNSVAIRSSKCSRGSKGSNGQFSPVRLKKRNSRFLQSDITERTDIHSRKAFTGSLSNLEASKVSDEEELEEDALTGLSLCKQRLEDFVLSPIFDAACGALILLNAVLIGAETEVIAQGGESIPALVILQHCLNAWYLIELCLRLSAQGWDFLNGEDRNWNIFDTFLVASAILDLCLTSFASESFKTARVLRVVRLFRIVRTLRIIRQFKYVREFRKMVCSLMASAQTLLWSLLLVFGVMYAFALWFTQSAADFRKDNSNKPEMEILIVEIETYYDSFSRTVFSLFAAISGGYSWHVLVDPWIAADENISVCFFFAYISVAVFGLMNIVTSVFVESAMHATKHFQDLLVDEKKKDLEMYMTHMETIFHVIDSDGGGNISFEEMAVFLEDAGSELPQYLEALGITSKDVWVLFKLLDTNDTGSIDIKDFCEGCMRLKGEARSFDINCMMYENRAMIKYQADFMEFVEERFEFMERQTGQMVDAIDKRFAVRMAGMMSRVNASSPSILHLTGNGLSDATLKKSASGIGSGPTTPRDDDKASIPNLRQKLSFLDEVESAPQVESSSPVALIASQDHARAAPPKAFPHASLSRVDEELTFAKIANPVSSIASLLSSKQRIRKL